MPCDCASRPIVRLLSGLFLAAVAAAAVPAAAQDAAEFYRSRTVSIIVGFGAGGGYDLYARLLARYLGAHIPGRPSVIVQNMDGAGSVRAANYVYTIAPKDGTVIGAVNQNAPMYQLLGGEGVQFDATRFNWLGSMAYSNGTLYTWHTFGVRSLEDAKQRQVDLGGAGPQSDSYIFATLINGLLGTKFKVINGYAGTKEIHLALEREEVMGRGGNSWASVMTSEMDWIRDKKINLLVQIGFKPEPEIPEVPCLIDLVTSPEDKQIVTLVTLPTAIGYSHWLAAGVPEARVAALRAAYDATMSDAAFRAEADKHGMTIRPQRGTDIAALVAKAAATPKPVVQRTAQLLGWQK